ncbi:MAG: hypothetical protein EXR69_07320 [Myxococcales bacterium]|nr:hypothetical protein [Myxococcales bacterium]
MLVTLIAIFSAAHAGAPAVAPPTAPTCDAKALNTALTEASPGPSAQALLDLAACDTVVAKLAAPATVKRMLAGPTGDAAALLAISLDQGQAVRDWITALVADERASTLNHLGEACDKPGVTTFWTDSAKALGDKFWSAGWYSALDACRVPAAEALLTARLAGVKNDRALFSAVLGTYATNAGIASVPTIQAMSEKETDPLVFIDLVRALPAAGGIGASSGADQARISAALAGLNAIAPKLPERAFPEARKAYLALGDEVSADTLSAIRYASVLQDGKLMYGIIALENATCKKGDPRMTLHAAMVWDTGHTWPDQLAERVLPNALTTFMPNVVVPATGQLAESCKGTGTVAWLAPEAPFANAAAYTAWVAAQKATAEHAHPGVVVKLDLKSTALSD